MPNIWAHLLFGQEVMEKQGLSEWIQKSENRRLFSFGCQGPDFLFYHRFLPWLKGPKLEDLGNVMHRDECGPFLMGLMEEAAKHPSGSKVQIYVLGFALHHVLDRNVHPYIYYRSGFRKWDHQRFEVMMDTLILRRKRGLATWKTPVWKEIDFGESLPDEITRILYSQSKTFYPEALQSLTSEDLNSAARDMIKAQKLFHDPTGIKRILTAGQISKLVYKRKVTLDVLNESRTPWYDPTGTGDMYDSSVWDMWEDALKDAETIIQAAKAYWSEADLNPLSESSVALKYELANAIGNISYDSAKPCGSSLTIKIADPLIPNGLAYNHTLPPLSQ
ncbi:zinc dependent phospholipase C family protein [Paenibacillus sediminis]|uniref:Phospholipase C/D domain-containing protein n=1 Tax=Paenibacillus sediminis TaxID=664909 RepID=A0ABS4H5Z4_9BACL|nr:hypothetical protein [Paenibacillus sediminis]